MYIEKAFKEDLKRLRLRRYDVCEILECTMPTLKSRIYKPETFTVNEMILLRDNGFDQLINNILKYINENENNKYSW